MDDKLNKVLTNSFYSFNFQFRINLKFVNLICVKLTTLKMHFYKICKCNFSTYLCTLSFYFTMLFFYILIAFFNCKNEKLQNYNESN